MHPPALETGNDRLSGPHTLCEFCLGKAGISAGLDQGTDEIELRRKFLIRRSIVRVITPSLVKVAHLRQFSTSLARCNAEGDSEGMLSTTLPVHVGDDLPQVLGFIR